MTPVTNKPPMPQAPGKGIKSFPTPVIDDVVITEIVNAWKGDYKALDYGVKWDEAPHASMQGSHPEHKLVFQDPASADGEWIKRIWVNDRVNQDSYNYAIKYSGGSQSHPIYIRTYVLPRESYAPLPDLTPDDVYPTALLVEEEVQRNEGELDSKYIKVTRVFETLQGPEISSLRYNERGDLEEIISQQVTPNTSPDPDGLLVTQSQVIKEDVSKGTKITATVPSHSTLTSKEVKGGLLGETVITDNIVSPTTAPDALSINVISSSVEQTSATKARKRTVASTSPTTLTSDVLASTPLGLVKSKKIESIVPTGTLPTNSLTKIADDVNAIDSAKSQKDETIVDSWPTLVGSDYDETLGLGFAWKKTIVSPPLTTCDSYLKWDAQPIDEKKTLKKEYIDCQVQRTLESYYNQINTSIPIKLPDTLQEITAYFGLSYGAGDSTSTGNGSGSNWSWSTGTSKKNSASVKGDLYFKIKQGFSGSIPCIQHVFFMKTSDVKTTNLLTALNNLRAYASTRARTSGNLKYFKDWPAIRLISENIVMIGGSMSETLATNQSRSASNQGGSSSTSNSKSIDVDVSVNSIVVPQTLHDNLPINIVQIGNTGNLSIPFSVNPNTLAATDPVKMPVGNYLYSSDVQLYKFGYSKVTAITIELTEDYV
jgi:hypothetical protein